MFKKKFKLHCQRTEDLKVCSAIPYALFYKVLDQFFFDKIFFGPKYLGPKFLLTNIFLDFLFPGQHFFFYLREGVKNILRGGSLYFRGGTDHIPYF